MKTELRCKRRVKKTNFSTLGYVRGMQSIQDVPEAEESDRDQTCRRSPPDAHRALTVDSRAGVGCGKKAKLIVSAETNPLYSRGGSYKMGWRIFAAVRTCRIEHTKTVATSLNE